MPCGASVGMVVCHVSSLCVANCLLHSGDRCAPSFILAIILYTRTSYNRSRFGVQGPAGHAWMTARKCHGVLFYNKLLRSRPSKSAARGCKGIPGNSCHMSLKSAASTAFLFDLARGQWCHKYDLWGGGRLLSHEALVSDTHLITRSL